jgi:hypothetical protein
MKEKHISAKAIEHVGFLEEKQKTVKTELMLH